MRCLLSFVSPQGTVVFRCLSLQNLKSTWQYLYSPRFSFSLTEISETAEDLCLRPQQSCLWPTQSYWKQTRGHCEQNSAETQKEPWMGSLSPQPAGHHFCLLRCTLGPLWCSLRISVVTLSSSPFLISLLKWDFRQPFGLWPSVTLLFTISSLQGAPS